MCKGTGSFIYNKLSLMFRLITFKSINLLSFPTVTPYLPKRFVRSSAQEKIHSFWLEGPQVRCAAPIEQRRWSRGAAPDFFWFFACNIIQRGFLSYMK